MPIVSPSTYKRAPLYQINGHFQTIFPSLFRKIEIAYTRERLELEDGDFLDIDWVYNNSKDLVILTHGLEGNAQRIYIKGMAKIFSTHNWDVLAWHCRSCSEEINRNFRLYHHGDKEDIGHVVNHALEKGYNRVILVGFSMGGNINLKYLGTKGDNTPKAIKGSVSFSAPCDLEGSASTLDYRFNFLYRNKFLQSLREKITVKAEQFPGRIDLTRFEEIEIWRDFDEYFSAPLNNYKDADEFYWQSSANNFIEGVRVPSLIVNALNDPILTPSCSPKALAEKHPLIYLENPKQGGHVGFDQYKNPYNWAEMRCWNFVKEVIL